MAAPTIEELLARLDEQRARIERLEGNAPEPAAAEPRMTRRGMLTTAAVGTLGIVGAVLLESEGTAAASGAGVFTSATATPAVQATNSGAGPGILASAGQVTAIHGSQTSPAAGAIAVRGTVDSKTPGAGIGVEGVSPHGIGVNGASDVGTGMLGTSNSGAGIVGTSGSTAANASAVHGTMTSTSPGTNSAAVRGKNSGTGSAGIGVYGTHAGYGYGVYGQSPHGAGVFGASDSAYGVYGAVTTGGYGVVGSSSDGTGTGVYGGSGAGTGVRGTASSGTGVTGNSSSGTAVAGTSSGGTGVHGTSSTGYGVYGQSPNNYGVVGVTTSGNGVYGQVTTATQAGVVGRTLDASGNWALYGYGNIGASGTKSAVVPASDGGDHLTLYCVESPECWFEDFGSAKLSAGSVTVLIDPEFAQTIHTAQYHVFLQAEGECKGLYVRSKTAGSFVVQELESGASNISFAYRIVALRKDVSAPRLNRVALPAAAVHAP